MRFGNCVFPLKENFLEITLGNQYYLFVNFNVQIISKIDIHLY